MAITDAQQAKQILMKKGGPVHRHQLAKKRKDGKRPGKVILWIQDALDTLLMQKKDSLAKKNLDGR